MAAAARWLLRFLNTALLAAAVWVLWQQTLQLQVLNDELTALVDYLSVIAERLN
jgi:hypothetical protein